MVRNIHDKSTKVYLKLGTLSFHRHQHSRDIFHWIFLMFDYISLFSFIFKVFLKLSCQSTDFFLQSFFIFLSFSIDELFHFCSDHRHIFSWLNFLPSNLYGRTTYNFHSFSFNFSFLLPCIVDILVLFSSSLFSCLELTVENQSFWEIHDYLKYPALQSFIN